MSTTAPDARTSIYTPVSPTTVFPAGFPVFDIDDISVYVDGVKRTDFNVTATFVEGISNDARAVFSPGVTGEVIIVGDREPRRQSRFGNGAPLPIWAQNLALDTLTAQVQESYRDIARAVLVPHGDTPPTLGAKGRELLASSTSAAAINALGGAGGLIVDAMIASLGAEKLTGTIDPARIPVLPNNVQVMSSGGIADLTILQQAQVVQGAIVTTTDGRRWVYLGAGDKLDEASYIALADITPEWSAISGKPAFGSAALDESGDFATAAQGVKADTALAALDTKFDKAGGTISGVTQLNSDLRAYTQVFFGYGLATGGQSVLGGFRSGNNWIFAGNNGEGGWNWGAALEWSAASGAWNFVGRPTFAGQPLATLAEVGSGSGVAGVSSFNGRTGTVEPQSGDYDSTQITHAAETVSAALSRAEVKTPWLTPEMFGAVGNGSTDDLAAFNAMIAAAGDRGARIFLPPKPYYLNSSVTLSNKPFTVEGVKTYGNSGSALIFSSNNGLRVINSNGTRLSGFAIRDITASTTDGITTGACSSGQLLQIGRFEGSGGSSYVDLENLDIYGGCRSVWVAGVAYLRARQLRVVGAYGPQAVLLCAGDANTYNVDGAEFLQCAFSAGNGSAHVIEADGKAQSIKFTQSAVLFGGIGIYCRNTLGGTSRPKFIYFSDGGFENSYKTPVYLDECDDVKFANTYISNDTGFSTGRTAADGIYMGANCQFVSMVGSVVRGCGRDGIRVIGGRLVASGNRFQRNDEYGIRLNSSAVAGCAIVGNYFGKTMDEFSGTDTQTAGILNNGGTNVIANNVSYGSSVLSGTTSGTGISGNITIS